MNPQTFLDNFATIADAPGGIERLREMVLGLALQGRLVDPAPTDEHVALLLQSIDNERTRTVRANGWRTGKSAGAIRDHEVQWAIPDHWAWVRLERLAMPQAGFAFKSTHFNQAGRGTPLIRIRDIGNGKTECHFEGEYRDEFLVQPGDYLVGMDGNFNIRRWQGPPALLNQRVARLIFFSDSIQRSFVTWALQDRINALHGRRAYTTVQHLSGKQIAAAAIPVPPLAEQERIVARVDELMGLCDELETRQKRRDRATTYFRGSAIHGLTEAETPDDLRHAWERVNTNWSALTDHASCIPALRRTALELAVKGRLAAVDPYDSSASDLLSEIASTRRHLSRRRSRAAAGAPKQGGPPASVPSGWAWAPFREVATIESNLVDPANFLTEAHIAPDNIEKETGKLLPFRTVVEDRVTSSKHRFVAGQILYSKIRPNLRLRS